MSSRRSWLPRRLVVVSVMVLAVTGCGSGSIPAASEATATATQAPPVGVPLRVRATLVVPPPAYHELAPGTKVPLTEVPDVAFATSEIGYALGGPVGYTYPEKTTNGGRSWSIDGPALFLPVADGADAVDDIVAASVGEAYAYGGPGAGSTIETTTDAGNQWWRAALGQAVVAVSQDGRHGSDLWALAAGPTTGSSVNAVPPMLLYESPNGGRTWIYRSTLSGVRGWEADLSRPTATTAFALVKNFGDTSASKAGIVETTDGGAHWVKRVDPCDKKFAGDDINWAERLQAASTTALWLFCGSQPSTGIQTKLVERSDDGGRSWTLVASDAPGEHVPPNAIPLEGQFPDTGTTGYLSVTSSSDAWLILAGDNNVLLKTTDGGHHWTEGAPPPIEAQFPQRLSLVDRSMFVKTQNALWERSGTLWKLIAGSRKPY